MKAVVSALLIFTFSSDQLKATELRLLDKNNKLNKEGRINSIDSVKKTVSWLTRKYELDTEQPLILDNGRRVVRSHGMRRKITKIRSKDGKRVEKYFSDVVTNKVCNSINFFINVMESDLNKYILRQKLDGQIANWSQLAIERLQKKDGPFAGGFITSEKNTTHMTTFTSAICGIYLYKAYRYIASKKRDTDLPLLNNLRKSLDLAGHFLLKMRRPSLAGGAYKDFRFRHDNGNSIKANYIHYWIDGVKSDKLVVATTPWNLLAHAFLEMLTSISEEKEIFMRTESIKRNEIEFYESMILKGYESFSPKFRRDSNDLRFENIVSKKGFVANSNSDDDNSYKARYGGSAIGSDMPEYVIVALKEIGEIYKRKKLLKKLIELPKITYKIINGKEIAVIEYDDHLSGSMLDPFVGFSGVFIKGYESFNKRGVFVKSSDGDLGINYRYYDFDAIVGESKRKFYPCRSQIAVSRIVEPKNLDYFHTDNLFGNLSHMLFASANFDLTPYAAKLKPLSTTERDQLNSKLSDGKILWQKGELVSRASMASSTVAHNALFVLKVLEDSYDDKITCK